MIEPPDQYHAQQDGERQQQAAPRPGHGAKLPNQGNDRVSHGIPPRASPLERRTSFFLQLVLPVALAFQGSAGLSNAFRSRRPESLLSTSVAALQGESEMGGKFCTIRRQRRLLALDDHCRFVNS